MSIYEYDEEKELRLIRADERQLGREEERENTDKERREKEEAIKEREEAVEAMISLCKEFGSTKEETAKKLSEKCKLSKAESEEKVNTYWEN